MAAFMVLSQVMRVCLTSQRNTSQEELVCTIRNGRDLR